MISLTLLATTPLLAAPQLDAIRTSTDARLEPIVTLGTSLGTVVRPPRSIDAVRTGPQTHGTSGVSALTINQAPEHDMPREVAFRANGSEAVIVGRDTDTVSFFDVATRAITHTVDVGDFPVHVATTPNDQYAVVANVLSNSVSVIDLATHTVAATVPVTGVEPYRVAVTTDSAYAVVGVINDAVSSTVSVIDLATFTEVRSFPTVPQGVIGGFGTPEPGIFGNIFTQWELASDDTTLVMPDRFGNRVALYDINTGAQLALLATPDLPSAVDISPDGTLAVIEHEDTGGHVSVIDVPTQSLTVSHATGNQMYFQHVAVTHDKAYAITGLLNDVMFVDLATGAVAATIGTGTVGDIEISFDGQYAIVPNFNTRVIDIATRTVVKVMPYASTYDAAVSPIEHRLVGLNNRFREDVHLYDTSGAAGFFEGAALSGEIEEGDAPRTLAVSGDGSTAIVVCNTSSNAAIVDVATGTVRAYVPTGLRSLGAAISADGTTAVVANAGSDTLSVIDLTTDTTVAQLSVPQVPAEVAIAPDGQTAYVTSLAGTDRLYFVDLAGAASSVTGSLVTGQMGSIGYTYSVFSGLSVSPDGSTLALCISFDDQLMLVDTATQSEVARVPVGDFPIRASFSPDSSRAYVTHSFGDSLVAVDVAGAGSSVVGTTPGIDFPLQVSVDSSGAYSYVGSFNFSTPRLYVVDNGTHGIVASLPLPGRPRSHDWRGGELVVTTDDGALHRIDASGAGTSILESAPLTGSPSDMVVAGGRALVAQPGVDDQLDLIDFPGLGTNFCVSLPNSSGGPAIISATGSTSIGANNLVLHVSSAAATQPGLFYYGANQIQLAFGNGFRCVGGLTARLNPPSVTDPSGAASRPVDFTVAPAGSGPAQILAGSTWNFQHWFRDPLAGGTAFDLSDGLALSFLP